MKLLSIVLVVVYYCRGYDGAPFVATNGTDDGDSNLLEIYASVPIKYVNSTNPVSVSVNLKIYKEDLLYRSRVSRTFVEIPVQGLINDPQSRAYKCKLDINKNCSNVKYESQILETLKGFPNNGPDDGKIAGGFRFPQLNQYGADRWVHEDISHLVRGVNETHVEITLNWYYMTVYKISDYHLYGTVNDYDETDEPIKRSNLQHLDTYQCSGTDVTERVTHTFQKDRLNKRGVLVSIWDIVDTGMAFYQVIDYTYNGYSELPTPLIDIANTTTTTTTNTTEKSTCEVCESPAPASSSCGIKTDNCYDVERLCQQYYAPSLCNCHQFYQLGGQIWLQECLGDLVFNGNACDWRFNVNANNASCPNIV